MDRRSFIAKTGVAAGAVAASTALAAPAIAQGRKEMVIVSSWPRDFPGLGISAQRLADRITNLTDGRIATKYFASGERVGGFDVFDEVASGNAQAYNSADYYWKGKHPAWAFFTSVPFGLTYTEQSAWINHLGGQALWDELAASFSLKCLPCGNTGVQMGGWFNKEIESADDLKGLKMRIPGLGGDVIAKVGGSPVSLPGSQIYENLVSGAIDATEWVGPYNDYFLKFYEAAKYYYYPGMHEPGGFISFGMNQKWWGGLTKTEQLTIEAACQMECEIAMSENNANNATYLKKLIDEHGVKLREFNDDVYDSFGEAAEQVMEETRAHSALAKKVHGSFADARKNVGGWMKLSDVSYSLKRNRVLGL
ncbi:MAG: TRAP transporter substrate-binding protein [Rhodospirillales bacterium]|nr:TRAP transporter substrate-binding protein [Rhodospirillales bacterium]MDH3910385.1 TRAP transporter substrate-binding protein [Rhodospirillales bacterium]